MLWVPIVFEVLIRWCFRWGERRTKSGEGWWTNRVGFTDNAWAGATGRAVWRGVRAQCMFVYYLLQFVFLDESCLSVLDACLALILKFGLCDKDEDNSGEEPKAMIVDFNLNFQIRKLFARDEVLDFHFALLKSTHGVWSYVFAHHVCFCTLLKCAIEFSRVDSAWTSLQLDGKFGFDCFLFVCWVEWFAPTAYETNGDYLNHCLISFLRRISHPKQLNLEALLYKVPGICTGIYDAVQKTFWIKHIWLHRRIPASLDL